MIFNLNVIKILVLIFKLHHLKQIYSLTYHYSNYSSSKILKCFFIQDKTISENSNLNKGKAKESKSTCTIISNEINKKYFKKPYIYYIIINLSYEEAIKYDKRSFCRFFLHSIMEKNILLSIFKNDSIIYPLSLRLIMLIFMLNAFLFLIC